MPDVERPFRIPVGNRIVSATGQEYQRALAEHTGEDREALKRINFVAMYGGSPQKFMVNGSVIDWKSYTDPPPAEYPSDAEKRAARALRRRNRRLGTLDELV